MIVRRAMVLAAGRGERMRPLTAACPKPLLEVADRTMLDRALDHLAAAGVEDVVVNAHYLAARIMAHLAARAAPRPTVLHEPILLDTGGGVVNALPHLGDEPFYVVNGDSVWTDGGMPALQRLAAAWNDATMDALLLLARREGAVGYAGRGDYDRGDDGRLARRRNEAEARYVFAGIQLMHPRLLAGEATRPFSLREAYDRAEAKQRLFGLVHDGAWYHVGTPDALSVTSAILKAQA